MSTTLRDIASGLPEGIAHPHTTRAMRVAAQMIRDRWISMADTHVRSGAYLASIQRSTAIEWLDDDAIQVHSTAKHALYLEYGHAGFHLAQRWSKWKSGPHGPYAIVPFEHGSEITKGQGRTPYAQKIAMPADIYAAAKRLPMGGSLGTYGNRGRRFKDYNEMRRVHENAPWIPNVPGYDWQASPYDRIHRYDAQPTKNAGRHSRYLAFRTITPTSTGWVIPPMPAFHFAERALDEALPYVERLLQDAALADMELALRDALGWMR